MSPIFVPTPVVPVITTPPVEVSVHPTYHYGFTIIGGDGSTWDLVQGPVYITEGASGFGFPTPTHNWAKSPLYDGGVYRSTNYDVREFAIPLEVDGRFLASEAEQRALEVALWKALNPRSEAMLVVTSPSGVSHSIPFRYSGGGDEPFTLDPLLRQDNVYPLEAEAGNPFWTGETVVRTYGVAADLPTFPGPPFNINDSTSLENTTIENNGDEAAWPRWTIDGPYSSVTVGAGNATVTLSTAIANGESRVIEMDPRRGRSIRDGNGNLTWGDATVLEFGTIDPGEQPLVMSGAGMTVGQTQITLEFDALYLRAFA